MLFRLGDNEIDVIHHALGEGAHFLHAWEVLLTDTPVYDPDRDIVVVNRADEVGP